MTTLNKNNSRICKKINIAIWLFVFMFAFISASNVTYTYDDLHRLKTVTYDNGTTIFYDYDSLGNRVSKVVTSSAQPLRMDTPNGGETWALNSEQVIQWSGGDDCQNVNIDISRDGGTNWDPLFENTANDGSEPWTVNGVASDQCLMRVTCATDSSLSDESDAIFTIVETVPVTISLTSPMGGESWEANTSHTISWNFTGTLDNVKIDYSIDNGTSWLPIETTIINQSPYTWNVANMPSSTCLVRVSDAADENISSISPSVFSITAPQQLTAPLNTPKRLFNYPALPPEATRFIVQKVSDVSLVADENNIGHSVITYFESYQTDDGSPQNPDYYMNCTIDQYYIKIDLTTNTILSTVKIPATDTLRIKRLTTIDDKLIAVFGYKDNTRSEALLDKKAYCAVKDLSADNFSTFILLDNYTSGSQVLTDSAALKIGSDYYVVTSDHNTRANSFYRVTSTTANFGSFSDEYSGPILDAQNGYVFTNYGKVYLLNNENPGKTNLFALTDSISFPCYRNFSTSGNIAGFKLWKGSYGVGFIVDAAQNKIELPKVSEHVIGVYEYSDVYIVAGIENDQFSVCLLDKINPTQYLTYSTGKAVLSSWRHYEAFNSNKIMGVIYVDQNEDFFITSASFQNAGPTTVQVISPNGGEIWVSGTSKTITWDAQGDISNVDVTVYRTDNTSVFNESYTTNSGSTTWDIPLSLAGEFYVSVKITDSNGTQYEDVSDSSFIVNVAGSVDPSFLDPLSISPDSTSNMGDVVIAVDNLNNLHAAWCSNFNLFYRKRTGGVWENAQELVSNGSVALNVEDHVAIETDSPNHPCIIYKSTSNDLFYIYHNGSTFGPPANLTGSGNVAFYRTASDSQNNIHIIYRDHSYQVHYRKITGGAVVSSASSTLWTTCGDTVGIAAAADGTVHAFRGCDGIAYMKCQDGIWNDYGNLISGVGIGSPDADTDSSGNVHLVWRTVSSQEKCIRYTTLNSSGVLGTPVFVSPYSGIPYIRIDKGDSPLVTTIATIDADTFLILYKKTSSEWSAKVLSTSAQSARRSKAPAVDSTNLIHAAFSNALKIFYSNGRFGTAAPALSFITPTEGENIIGGSNYFIQWNISDLSNVSGVTVSESVDGGNSYTPVYIGLNGSSCTWLIPNISGEIKLRLCATLVGGENIEYLVNVNITAQQIATLEISSPNGGETWEAGSTQTITWNSTGSVGNVKIEYSTAGMAGTFVSIIDSVENSGSYQWTVPNMDSDQCVIRISETDGSPIDTSDGLFTIQPALESVISVTAPNGGEKWRRGSTQTISWNHENISGNVSVQLYKGESQAADLGSVDIDAGSLSWSISTDLVVGNDYRIRVFQDNEEDFSDSYFIISTATHPDFNNDGLTDLLWRHNTTGENGTWLMNGTTRTDIIFLNTLNPDWESAGTADFNGDGKTDIMWRHKTTGENGVWMMDGTVRTEIIFLPTLSDINWKCGGLADFNGDGKTDIMWRNQSTGQNGVWMMDGTVRTEVVFLPSLSQTDWKCRGLGDFNGDGKPDIFWRHLVTGENAVWFMDGVVRTGNEYLNSLTDMDWICGGLGDFNNDGKPDIFWRHQVTGQNGVWFMDGTTRTYIEFLNTLSDTAWELGN